MSLANMDRKKLPFNTIFLVETRIGSIIINNRVIGVFFSVNKNARADEWSVN